MLYMQVELTRIIANIDVHNCIVDSTVYNQCNDDVRCNLIANITAKEINLILFLASFLIERINS